MRLIIVTWGAGNLLTIGPRDDVLARTGPDAARVVRMLGKPMRRFTTGDVVVDTKPGDRDHALNVVRSIPFATITDDG